MELVNKSESMLKHELSESARETLSRKKVAVVGLGGVGSTVSQLLARIGVGTLVLVDGDYVVEEIIRRQILYNKDDVDMPKAVAAKENLYRINPLVHYVAYAQALTQSNISSALDGVDLIVDATDNMRSKYLLNEFALSKKIPLVHTAVANAMGVVFTVVPSKSTPCLQCLYPKDIVEQAGELSIATTSNVWNFVMVLIGSIATSETIKVLLDTSSANELIYVNVLKEEIQKINVEKDSSCDACSGRYEILNSKPDRVMKLGGVRYYIVPSEDVDFDSVVTYLSSKRGKLKYNEHILHYLDERGIKVSIFRDGHGIVDGAGTSEAAMKIYDDLVAESKASSDNASFAGIMDKREQQTDMMGTHGDEETFDFAKEEGDEASQSTLDDDKEGTDGKDSGTSNVFFPNPFE